MLNLLLNKWIDRLAERIIARQQQPMVRIIGNSNLGYRRVGDLLTFYATTSLATGARNDADSVPNYIIYEEENGTEIVASTAMALLDSGTTDGLYSEQITLAEATGYEFQKDYLIYIFVTVSSIVSHAIYSFRIGPEGALRSAQAQAGAAGTITLASAESTTDDLFNGVVVAIIGGTGAGQSRVITDYVGSTRVATIEPNWITNPSSSSIYALYHAGRVAVHTDGITAASIATDAIDADAIAANAIGSSEIANDAITAAKIAAGAIDAATFAAGAIDAAAIANGAIDAATFAAGAIDAAAIANGAIDAATFAAGAIDAAAIATNAIDADALAADAVAEIQSGLATSAALANVQADTDDIQTRLPATLNGGRMRSHVEAMDPGTITAAVIATDAIDADALATSAVDEIIASVVGTADSGSTTTLVDAARTEADVDYWKGSILLITSGSTAGQLRLITAFDPTTDTITVDPAFTQAISTNDYKILKTAIGTSGSGGGPTEGQIADAVWDELRAGHVVAGSFGEGVASVQGNVTGSVGSVAAGGITAASIATNAIDADALATDAVNEIVDQVWDEGLAGHLAVGSTGEALNNAGSGASAAVIADAVWDEAQADHVAAGSMGANQNLIDEVLADTDNLQTRVPPALHADGGILAHVIGCDPPCTGGGGGAVVDDFEAVPG